MENISVPTGKIIGIGKLKVVVPVNGHNFPFPTLSFVVSRAEDNNYTASCLNLQVDASANQHKEAIDRLVTTCHSFITTLFSLCPDTAWDQLYELASWDDSKWWGAYRKFEMLLAKNGISTDRDMEQQLLEKITQLQEELNTYKHNYNSGIMLKVVSYNSIDEAA